MYLVIVKYFFRWIRLWCSNFKEVATILGLSPEGKPVNLDQFQYTVTEESTEDIIISNECATVGIRHNIFFENVLDNLDILYGVLC